MNVLLSYTSNPVTTAAYLEKAMRRICGVITHGPTISKDMLGQWDLLAVEKKVRNLQIPFLNGNMEDVLDQLPAGWEPDVFLYVDTGLFYSMKNMSALNCLKACYFIDSHLAFDLHLEIAENYDVVFTAHKPAVEMFKKRGIENVFWVPTACDPEIHGKKSDEKLYDIGFVGSPNPERVHLLTKMKKRFNTYYERCFLEKMSEVFSRSKIVFHKSVRNDLAMRVFEVLASGSLLLANEARGSGLVDLFQDRKHIVIYRNEKELMDLADYYLRNEAERKEIAVDGMEKVLKEHTYSHRAEEMVRTLSLFKKLRDLKS